MLILVSIADQLKFVVKLRMSKANQANKTGGGIGSYFEFTMEPNSQKFQVA